MKKRIRNLVVIVLSFVMLFSATLFSSNAACTGWVTFGSDYQCMFGQRCVLPSPENMYTLQYFDLQERYCEAGGITIREVRITASLVSCCFRETV